MPTTHPNLKRRPLAAALHEIIFEADTPAGRKFDILLIWAIILSVCVVMLESVSSIRAQHQSLLTTLELAFTLLFTCEYILRLYSVRKAIAYATSFYGVIDLISILPTWLALVIPNAQYLIILRLFRVLRIFRVLKLAQYLSESRQLVTALKASRRKITIFLCFVLTLATLFGALLYVVEGEKNGFTSIPRSIYWAIVTLTTVGYGDISPKTDIGQAIASVVMVLGYSILAVPTGIVSAEIAKTDSHISTQACPACAKDGHDTDANHCKYCGCQL